jgi:acetoin:2,6-dichlorophenolindophenol oxidoreductase subunit beta
VPDGEHLTPLGEAEIVRAGDAVTLVTWSAMRHTCAGAAEALAQEGIAVEVIDLRTLWPWDRDTVFASVERTGRLLVVHEAVAVSGFGAEIAASVAEALHDRLKAPVRRLGAPRIPVAYAPAAGADGAGVGTEHRRCRAGARRAARQPDRIGGESPAGKPERRKTT